MVLGRKTRRWFGRPNHRSVVQPAEIGRPNRRAAVRPAELPAHFDTPPTLCASLKSKIPFLDPLKNMTPAVATGRLLCAPPCVGTAFCVHRLACGPLNNMTPAVATGRLLCASEGPGGASERPGGSAGRVGRPTPPPSRTTGT